MRAGHFTRGPTRAWEIRLSQCMGRSRRVLQNHHRIRRMNRRRPRRMSRPSLNMWVCRRGRVRGFSDARALMRYASIATWLISVGLLIGPMGPPGFASIATPAKTFAQQLKFGEAQTSAPEGTTGRPSPFTKTNRSERPGVFLLVARRGCSSQQTCRERACRPSGHQDPAFLNSRRRANGSSRISETGLR